MTVILSPSPPILSGPAKANAQPCPACGQPGMPVDQITVRHLVQEAYKADVSDGLYCLCQTENCDVAYYASGGNPRFTKAQLQVPLWYKEGAAPRYACYCSQVTIEEVEAAVKDLGAVTVADVNRLTGAMKHPDCRLKHPFGRCCHPVIQEILNPLKPVRNDIDRKGDRDLPGAGHKD